MVCLAEPLSPFAFRITTLHDLTTQAIPTTSTYLQTYFLSPPTRPPPLPLPPPLHRFALLPSSPKPILFVSVFESTIDRCVAPPPPLSPLSPPPPVVLTVPPRQLQHNMDSWRVAVLGDGGVGKTALAVQVRSSSIDGWQPIPTS